MTVVVRQAQGGMAKAVLLCGLFIAASSGQPKPNPLQQGDICRLRSLTKDGLALLSRTANEYPAVETVARRNNDQELSRWIVVGKAIPLLSGTGVRIVRTAPPLFQVRVIDGPNVVYSGWVSAESLLPVRKKKAVN